MFLRSLPQPTISLTRLVILAGLILLAAPVAYGQGGLTADGVQGTPASLTLDPSATAVKHIDVEPDASRLGDVPNKTPGWDQIIFEGGGDFPNHNSWNVFDADPVSGDDYWDDVTCRPHAGNWSIWCADVGNPDCTFYDNDMFAWMIVGPFSLADALDAQMLFAAWSEVEDTYDDFFVGASINGSNFFGATLSQDFTWTDFTFDLTNVFTLGDLRGQPAVWIAFTFATDSSVTYEGVYVDDILIEKITPNCTPSNTTLCLPDSRRFSLAVNWATSQGGGQSGVGQTVSLEPVGVTKGGVFYFSDPANPEMLVKVLNGCPINNHWWVFFAATTNVGFNLTVTDTVTNQTVVYTNPDVHPANAVTDTRAFATCP